MAAPAPVRRYFMQTQNRSWNSVTRFWDRPYRTVGDAVPQALLADITDPLVTGPPLIGSIEQWASSVDILSSPGHRSALRAAYSVLADAG